MKVIVTTITRSPRGNPMRASRKIQADQIRIGRGAECELRLADPRVPLHARSLFLGRSGPQLLEASESFSDATLTGTARTQVLKPGASVRIGPYQIDVAEPHHDADLVLRVELVQPLPGKATATAEELTAATRPRGLSRRRLSWGLFLLVVAAFLYLPMLAPQGKAHSTTPVPTLKRSLQNAGNGARTSWNPGELAAGHQAFGSHCESCHSAAFTRVQDKDCRACHQNIADHVAQQQKVTGLADVRCASCHRDHQGPQGLAQQNTHYAMGECSACHRDIKSHMPSTLTGNAGDFATLHPQFRASVVTGALATGKEQVERLRSELDEYAHGIKGHLRVFANTTALGEFLPPVLRTYLQGHPDVSVDLRERSSHDIVRAVGDGQTDIGIVAGTVRTEDLQALPYRSDRLVLVVPRGHALARRKEVGFADTLDLDYIGLHESSAIHSFLQQACSGLDRSIKLRIQVGNFEAACRMIEAKIGVGVMPRSAASRHAQTMAIGIVPLADHWALRDMKICVRDLAALPPFARDLVDLLVDDAKRAQPA